MASPELREGTLVTVSIGVIANGSAALVIALWYPSLVKTVVGPLEKAAPLRRLVTKVFLFHEHVYYFRNKRALIAKAMAYSFLFHICTAINV